MKPENCFVRKLCFPRDFLDLMVFFSSSQNKEVQFEPPSPTFPATRLATCRGFVNGRLHFRDNSFLKLSMNLFSTKLKEKKVASHHPVCMLTSLSYHYTTRLIRQMPQNLIIKDDVLKSFLLMVLTEPTKES